MNTTKSASDIMRRSFEYAEKKAKIEVTACDCFVIVDALREALGLYQRGLADNGRAASHESYACQIVSIELLIHDFQTAAEKLVLKSK